MLKVDENKKKDIEELLKNCIKKRTLIDIVDKNGLTLQGIVPVHYEDEYLECVRPEKGELLVFNSINEIVIIDDLSEDSKKSRRFFRMKLHEVKLKIHIGEKTYDNCSILDYCYGGLGIKVPEDISPESQTISFTINEQKFPCEFIYYNAKLKRLGVSFNLKIGKEIVRTFQKEET